MIDAYVVGGDLTALVAALDLAEVGLRVRVGVGVGVAEEQLPLGPQRDAEGTLTQLCDHLAGPVREGGPRHDHLAVVSVPPPHTALRGKTGEWHPTPEPSVLGIPAVPLAKESTALLGAGTAFRAYLDRVKPVLTIGKTRWLATLVNSRVGAKTRALLVDPIVVEQFGRDASEVEVAVAAPGLNETVSRTGSLTGAVLAYAERHATRETRVEPAAGWDALHEALFERLRLYAVEIVAERVTNVVEPVEPSEASGPEHEGFQVTVERQGKEAETLVARSVVVGGPATDTVLRGIGIGLDGDDGDGGLRNRAVRARAHVGVRTPEWADGISQGSTSALVCETFGTGERWSARIDLDAATAELRGPALESQGGPIDLEELSELLERAGVSVDPASDWTWRWEAAPFATQGERDRSEAALDAFHASHPGILATGAELHGGDLSVALGQARDSAVALRRRLLGLSE